MSVRVLASGPSATIQDLGRPGWFSAGVGVAGAADVPSLRLANRLVGNDASAAGIECVLGGLELETTTPTVLSVTGAPAPVSVDGVPVAHGSALPLQRGQRVRLGMADVGLRVYVGIRGGIDVPPVLGSRSTDTLAGLGPEPLAAGAELRTGRSAIREPLTGAVFVSGLGVDPVVVRVALGPRDDWFTRPADLLTGGWAASDRLDRVGIRLAHSAELPGLVRRDDRELPSEGMPLGAIQVPPSGEPVVFLADHPITGGYPVIAVVSSADIPRLAQVRPGQEIRFTTQRESAHAATTSEIRIAGNPNADEMVAALAVVAPDAIPTERGSEIVAISAYAPHPTAEAGRRRRATRRIPPQPPPA